MTADVRVPPSGSRILYPELPTPLSPADLHRGSAPVTMIVYDDRRWAPTVARTPAAQGAVLVQLGVFRALGRFLAPDAIPSAVIEYVAERVEIKIPAPGEYSPSTVYRHQRAVLSYLGVAAWNAQARQLTESTMAKMAEARTDPADLINAAVDALVRHRFELPTLTLLRRLASLAHHTVNEQQWSEICARLTDPPREALEAILVVAPDARESPFARVCGGAGRATRKNLKALIERYQWLCTLPDPTKPLASIAEAKVLQWANEARRLKAPELRAYVTVRTLLLMTGAFLAELRTFWQERCIRTVGPAFFQSRQHGQPGKPAAWRCPAQPAG